MRIRYVIRIAVVLVGLAALGSLVLVFRWHLGAQSALAMAGAVLCAILAISVVIAWSWLFQARARSIVQKWASEHGYVVCSSRVHSIPAHLDGGLHHADRLFIVL